MTAPDGPRVYHSFRSPYSRLGLHLLKRAGVNVAVIPFGGPPEGVPFNDPVQNKLKRAYYGQDAPRMAMRMGLPITRPSPFDVDFDPANKALIAAERDGVGLDFAIAVSDARWGRGEDVSDLDVLAAAAKAINWRAEIVEAAQTDETIANLLEEQRDWIAADGVFGVPFAINGPEKFWGHDRFEIFIESIRS